MRSLDREELIAACTERGLWSGGGPQGAVAPSRSVLRSRLNSWLQLSLNREVPSSLLLLSVAFIQRDSQSIADSRGPQAVKIAVLEAKQRRYHGQLKALQGKIRDVGLDLQRERSELEAQEAVERDASRAEQAVDDARSMSALEGRTAEAVTAEHAAAKLDGSVREEWGGQGEGDGGGSESSGSKDRRLLSLLRGKEEVAVQSSWGDALVLAGLARHGVGQRRLTTARWRDCAAAEPATLRVNEAVGSLHALLSGHKSTLAADTDPILQYLVEERRDDDDDGVNFTEYVEGYMELRRRAEERTDRQRRAEAVAKLEQLLERVDDVQQEKPGLEQ